MALGYFNILKSHNDTQEYAKKTAVGKYSVALETQRIETALFKQIAPVAVQNAAYFSGLRSDNDQLHVVAEGAQPVDHSILSSADLSKCLNAILI